MAAGYGDFIIFYTGAQIINDGNSKELFKIEMQNDYQAKFDVPQLEWPLPFNHAPYELLLFLPLVQFSYPIAHAIWSGLNLLLLAVMLRWLLLYVESPNNVFIAAAVLAWFPTMEALRLASEDHSRIPFDANDYRMLRIEELRLSASAAALRLAPSSPVPHTMASCVSALPVMCTWSTASCCTR